jgi:acetyl-CoA synthetase
VTAADEALRAARDQLLAARADHDRALADFSWPEVGERFNWAHDWFDIFARGNDTVGLVVVEEDGSAALYTFNDLVEASDRLAAWLSSKGVSKGDAILVMLGNQVELWQIMLAIMKLGAVIVPTTTAVGPADLADRIDRGKARFVVCNPDDEQKLADVPGDYQILSTASFSEAERLPAGPVDHPETSPSDRLLLYFTSGTTSKPKLVEHTQVSYPVGHLSTMYWLGLQPGDVHLNISSPGWAKHAWSCFFAPWLAEATVVVYNYRRFDPAALLRVIKEQGVTTFCAPPTVWRMLIQSDLSGGCGGLRELLAAGEPLNPEVIDQVRSAWGLTIRDGYGQTETTAQIGNTPRSAVKPGSMGRPLPGVPVALVDPLTGQETTSEGEICLRLGSQSKQGGFTRPVNLMTGYQDDEDRQSAATGGGYYHTGDIASMDADGYLTFIGRTDDVFKASDYKISPFELESVLLEHPAVAEAAVVPAPDPLRLAVPKAYVALAAGFQPTRQTAYEILRYAREHLAPYQRVRRLEFLELPKTISGKIRRVELRGRERESSPKEEYRDEDFPELHSPQSEPAPDRE